MRAMGVHCVDVLCFILGQEVVEITAITDGQSHERPLERLAMMCRRFNGGALGTVCYGLKAVRVTEAMIASAARGRLVKLVPLSV
jgi:predicted dehydrogenase